MYYIFFAALLLFVDAQAMFPRSSSPTSVVDFDRANDTVPAIQIIRFVPNRIVRPSFRVPAALAPRVQQVHTQQEIHERMIADLAALTSQDWQSASLDQCVDGLLIVDRIVSAHRQIPLTPEQSAAFIAGRAALYSRIRSGAL